MEIFQVVRLLFITFVSFVVALLTTPILTHFLYKHKMGKSIRNTGATPIFSKLHKKKAGTPTMGGIVIWGTVIILAFVFLFGSALFGGAFEYFNFVDRAQTYLPLTALVIAALLGLADDVFGVIKDSKHAQGLKVRHKLILYTVIAAAGAWWFYVKLEWTELHIPFFGDFAIGWWYIPLFMFILIASAFSANETDGLDGLAGGTLLIAYAAMAVVAFTLGRYDLAAFIGAIIGSLVAFLWFNIYPARFFMGDTGSMSLGITLGVISMLTNTALLLPFFAFVLVGESLSVIIQLTSKKLFKRKVFRSAPVHHHFEAIGWPETKVTMRFWIISAIMATLGLIVFFLDLFL